VSHCDDEELSLMALGESPDEAAAEHLASCALCGSRLDQLAAVVASARSVSDADRPVAPPDAVWQQIRAELDADSATIRPIDSARSSRRPRVWLIAAAAAVLGVVAGGLVTSAVTGAGNTGDVVASATLAPIDGAGLSGTASIERTDGEATLTVDVPDLPPVADGYYEVWMATSDTTTMVAIGTLNPGERAAFTLPAGMDVSSFPVVDVSVEHFDGNAGHSATSVVRGQLQA
jgi:hypothetical protein